MKRVHTDLNPDRMFDAVCKDRKDPMTISPPLALAFTQWFDDEVDPYWQVAWTTNWVDLHAYADENYRNVAAVIRQLTDRPGHQPNTQINLIERPNGMFAPVGKDRKDPITPHYPVTLGFTQQVTDECVVYWQVAWTTDCADSHVYADECYHTVTGVMRQLTGRGPWHLPTTGPVGLIGRMAALLGQRVGPRDRMAGCWARVDERKRPATRTRRPNKPPARRST
jgi:hypothetical protein